MLATLVWKYRKWMQLSRVKFGPSMKFPRIVANLQVKNLRLVSLVFQYVKESGKY
jgi:hypothetical protein